MEHVGTVPVLRPLGAAVAVATILRVMKEMMVEACIVMRIGRFGVWEIDS